MGADDRPRLTPMEKWAIRSLAKGPQVRPFASSSREEWHVSRLLAFGLITKETGFEKRLHITAAGLEWVDQH